MHGESVSELSPSIPEVSEENQNLLPIPSETHEDHADITDGMTSKSESSAPTTIEVPQSSVRPDSPVVEYPHIGPHTGMVRPFLSNGGRQFPPSNQVVHPHLAHQFRPVYQAPFTHQAMPAHHIPPALHIPPASQHQLAHQVLPASQGPPANQLPPVHHVIEPPPPSYQKCMEMASQSSSSIGDNSVLSRSNSKRKRNSNESLGSRNESGSVGQRSRKQLQAQASSSSAISEVPGPVSSRPSDSANARNAAQSLGASNPRPQNRYRDGRARPEPKQWNRATRNKIAYVPIPHVSKIHREPLHNETSV